MSMVESRLGISILQGLILQRIPYQIVIKELDIPAYRNIGLAMKNKKSASLAVKRFLECLPYRNSTVQLSMSQSYVSAVSFCKGAVKG